MPYKSFISLPLEFYLAEPFSYFAEKDTMVLISMLKSVSGSKKPTNEIIHAEFIKELVKYNPDVFVLLAGLLKRWNYWEMVRELTDKELIEYLADIPAGIKEEELCVILAKKFLPLAKKLEQESIVKLKRHLKKLNLDHIRVYTWDERHKFKNYHAENKEPKPIEFNMEDFKTTKKEFLENKTSLLKKTQNRMINAQPNLKHINFNKLDYYCCYHLQREEFDYCNDISLVEMLYRGQAPAILKPIFSDKNRHWHPFSYKESVIKESKNKLVRSQSIPLIKINPHSLAERRLKFFTPLKISNEPENEKNSDQSALTLEVKHSYPLLDKNTLSPKTEHKMKTLIELLSKSPPSEKKELVMLKLEEITRLLTVK